MKKHCECCDAAQAFLAGLLPALGRLPAPCRYTATDYVLDALTELHGEGPNEHSQ